MARQYIKEPTPEIWLAWELLNQAVDAHLAGDSEAAQKHFVKSDMRVVWDWLNPAWGRPHLHVKQPKPDLDTFALPKHQRDPDRKISAGVRSAVLVRDGYRCRYCGLPVIEADVRKQAHRTYPLAVPWLARDPRYQHAAFQCLWLQFDHVVPHSHGGPTNLDNIVVSCALCNFGKDKYTLKQLDLEDPRDRDPVPAEWDGLDRFRS